MHEGERERIADRLTDEAGQALLEYGLLGSLIAAVCAAAVLALGVGAQALWSAAAGMIP
jgi:Flp pilus assembly pilin Flp